MIKLLEKVKAYLSGSPEASEMGLPVTALDSGPTPDGPLTITLNPAEPSTVTFPLFISDLGLRGLRMVTGDSYDLGSLYTQKQISDSTELKRALASGIVLATLTGTIPSKEQTELVGIPTAAAVSIIDQTSSIPMTVNGDGSINVNLTTFGDTKLIYGVITNIAPSIDATIATYTVPIGKTFYLKHIIVSGTNKATYKVRVNGSPIALKRTYYTELNADFSLESDSSEGLVLVVGDVVDVRVIHGNTVSNGDFNSTISGRLE